LPAREHRRELLLQLIEGDSGSPQASRRRALKRSPTNNASAWKIEIVDDKDAMILAHKANSQPDRISERTVSRVPSSVPSARAVCAACQLVDPADPDALTEVKIAATENS
jgi:hypothetical protein